MKSIPRWLRTGLNSEMAQRITNGTAAVVLPVNFPPYRRPASDARAGDPGTSGSARFSHEARWA